MTSVNASVLNNQIDVNGVSCVVTNNFVLHDNAVRQIEELTKCAQNENNITFLRIMIDVGGCSGMRYHMILDDYVSENDLVVLHNDKPYVVIDEYSMEYIKDGVLEYEETLEGANFKIQNPNASASCSCGSSFGCGM